jgi:hypothetical protein
MNAQQNAAQGALLTSVNSLRHPPRGAKGAPSQQQEPTSGPPTLLVNSSARLPVQPNRSNGTKFYAIAKGRETGIFTSWNRVLTAVGGYPLAKYKRFKTRPEAEIWLVEQLSLQGVIPPTEDLSDDDGASEYGTVNFNEAGRQTDVPRPATLPRNLPFTYPQIKPVASNKELVDFHMSAPDTSVGKPAEICDVSINVSTAVRDLLCPKGLTLEMQNRLIEVVPDILAAPGKLSSSVMGETPDPSVYVQFAEALADFADVQAQRVGGHWRDTQLKSPGRNFLAKIDSAESAVEAVTQLAAIRWNSLNL